MSPTLQVIFGELLGIIIMLAVWRICVKTNSTSTIVVFSIGTVVLTFVFAYFYIGRQDLFFSNNILKNIFIIIMYEEIICIVVCALILAFSKLSFLNFTKADFSMLYYSILIITSFMIGKFAFYDSIVKAIGV